MTFNVQPAAPITLSASSSNRRTSSDATNTATGFSPDVLVLLDVLARIERRRQQRLWALGLKEAS
ncbi:MAG TPA: hypothetical protein VGS80_25895 [Ktedonobacterales bacterium]|nr:hypothetical protein [Ktedonobacterales bacterium]